jgi:hypothetical protein
MLALKFHTLNVVRLIEIKVFRLRYFWYNFAMLRAERTISTSSHCLCGFYSFAQRIRRVVNLVL